MTELLEQAITQLKTLPTTEQDAIAYLILEEIKDQTQGEVSFAKSPEVLTNLAKFYDSLLSSGLVSHLKQTVPKQIKRPLIEIQGKPISSTIIEERC